MDKKYKKELALRMLARASSSLDFVCDYAEEHSGPMDGAHIRSLSILLSYCIELLLKAEFVLVNEFKDKDVLERSLKRLNHDLVAVAQKLGQARLKAIGIKSIHTKRQLFFVGYILETLDGEVISVENFIDIRYDFIKDWTRTIPTTEEFLGWVIGALKINNNIKKLHF